ncbi:MAG: shikimate dehydrogenase [Clostridia bacterium]|nr:shikimate dehydrogenase [Clostridia bacterium]
MKDKTLRLGLVGKDVSKSDSEKIHKFILGELGVACEYQRFSVTAEAFDGAMRSLLGDFDGFNITIPYKRDVFEYLDEIVGDAFDFGAVNTVVSATRKGYNTDGIGFLQMLAWAGIAVEGKKILVLGAGGSGRSTAAALKKSGASVWLYRRNKAELQEVCEQLKVGAASDPEEGGYDILVNCTGVGMHDTEGRSPVGASAFAGASAAVDLIYTPRESEFLRLAKERGLQTLNGASMLFFQAYFADCLYLQKTPDFAEAKALYEKYLIVNP